MPSALRLCSIGFVFLCLTIIHNSLFIPPVSAATYFVHSDHLGSVSLVTDEQGAVVDREVYYPFGSPRSAISHTPYAITDKSYTSQTSDVPETGLYYYHARYYDPTLGRFTTPDTVPDGFNRYAYVGNNPVNYTDPSGHSGVSCANVPQQGQLDCQLSVSPWSSSTEATYEDLRPFVDFFTLPAVIVAEPIDWLVTGYHWANNDISGWDLLGLLPFLPSGSGRVARNIISKVQDFIKLNPKVGDVVALAGDIPLSPFGEGVHPVKIADLHPHEVGYNPTSVDLLNTAMERGDNLPPIKYTTYLGTKITVDGDHRTLTALQRGLTEIPAQFTPFNKLDNTLRRIVVDAYNGFSIVGRPVPSSHTDLKPIYHFYPEWAKDPTLNIVHDSIFGK